MIPKEYNKETMAKVVGRAVPISTRQAIEISNFIRGKNVQKMKGFLKDVTRGKRAVPFTRFNKGLGHKPGMGPGRFPMNACSEILMLLKSAESNAQFKALNTSNLVIGHVNANKASMSWHYGRQRRRRMKRTNMEIILIEKGSVKEKEVKGGLKDKKAEEKAKEPPKKEKTQKKAEPKQGAEKDLKEKKEVKKETAKQEDTKK